MDPAMAFVLALSLIVPRLTVADSPLRLQRSFWTSACTSILEMTIQTKYEIISHVSVSHRKFALTSIREQYHEMYLLSHTKE